MPTLLQTAFRIGAFCLLSRRSRTGGRKCSFPFTARKTPAGKALYAVRLKIEGSGKDHTLPEDHPKERANLPRVSM